MYVDVEMVRAGGPRYKVTYNGIDISNSCEAADNCQGWADCFVSEPDGALRIVDGGSGQLDVMRVRLRGRIKIEVIPRG